jgi:hypothetical protein
VGARNERLTNVEPLFPHHEVISNNKDRALTTLPLIGETVISFSLIASCKRKSIIDAKGQFPYSPALKKPVLSAEHQLVQTVPYIVGLGISSTNAALIISIIGLVSISGRIFMVSPADRIGLILTTPLKPTRLMVSP